VKEVVFTSPPNKLDATLLRLKEPFYEGKVEPYQITPDLPEPEEHRRVYIAGHPGGGDLNVSLHDNHLLEYNDELMQYRTPTDPGSSGSPVFNDEWELVGLHHAGSSKKQTLHDPSKEHEANEGIRISAIMKAIKQAH
jgi:V8-like Glu-specific endopeptidase